MGFSLFIHSIASHHALLFYVETYMRLFLVISVIIFLFYCLLLIGEHTCLWPIIIIIILNKILHLGQGLISCEGNEDLCTTALNIEINLSLK